MGLMLGEEGLVDGRVVGVLFGVSEGIVDG